jgi:phosphatidylserine decarboxylase
MTKQDKDTPDPRIFIYHREKKVVEEEVSFPKCLTRLFYGTWPGRLLTNLFLTRRPLSKLYGRWQSARFSARKIERFIDKHGIDMGEVQVPPGGFKSFNDFFTRKLRRGSRPVQTDPEILISPADSRLIAYPVEDETVYPVKGVSFTLQDLLGDDSIGRLYQGGTCLIFRLAPTDYHRFCYLDDGNQGPVKSAGGKLHSVNPLALRQNLRVFQENYRERCKLFTKNFGEVIQSRWVPSWWVRSGSTSLMGACS